MRPNLTLPLAGAPSYPGSAVPPQAVAILARTVAAVVCETGPPFPCPYIKGRRARFSGIECDRPLPTGLYEALMQANFRRNGPVVYRPVCEDCNACRMARIDVNAFAPDRGQRRCARANSDLTVRVTRWGATQEKHDLYARYLKARHPPKSPAGPTHGEAEFVEADSMDGSWEEFTGFLYSTCVDTVDFEYRDPTGRLLAVSVVDVEPRALSAVYCYFDPQAARRSLGTFNIMHLVREARAREIPHVYLGYWIEAARKMNYKSRFRGVEVLGGRERGDPEFQRITVGAPSAASMRAETAEVR